MSFDVALMLPPCVACGRSEGTVYEFNLTHNVNEIVDRCLTAGGATVAKRGDSCYRDRSWGRLVGWTAAEAAPVLERALAVSRDPERHNEFRALEPKNKWGSLDAVQRVLGEFLSACLDHPGATVEAHG